MEVPRERIGRDHRGPVFLGSSRARPCRLRQTIVPFRPVRKNQELDLPMARLAIRNRGPGLPVADQFPLKIGPVSRHSPSLTYSIYKSTPNSPVWANNNEQALLCQHTHASNTGVPYTSSVSTERRQSQRTTARDTPSYNLPKQITAEDTSAQGESVVECNDILELLLSTKGLEHQAIKVVS